MTPESRQTIIDEFVPPYDNEALRGSSQPNLSFADPGIPSVPTSPNRDRSISPRQ